MCLPLQDALPHTPVDERTTCSERGLSSRPQAGPQINSVLSSFVVKAARDLLKGLSPGMLVHLEDYMSRGTLPRKHYDAHRQRTWTFVLPRFSFALGMSFDARTLSYERPEVRRGGTKRSLPLMPHTRPSCGPGVASNLC